MAMQKRVSGFGLHFAKRTTQLLAKKPKTFVVEIAHDDERRGDIFLVGGKGLAVTSQKPRELIKENSAVRPRRCLQAPRYPSYTLICRHSEGVLVPDDLWDEQIECRLTGLIFDQDLKMHRSYPGVQIVAVPKSAEGQPFGNHILHKLVFTRLMYSGESVISLLKNPDFIGFKRVNEVWLVCGHKHLRTVFPASRVIPELRGHRL